MSTISKIKVGNTDYGIRDENVFGLGTKIGKSTNLNDLHTPESVYYFDGIEDNAPTNSPTTSAYRLAVRQHPNGASGNVIQRIESKGFAAERVGYPSGTSYAWGDWEFVNGYDSGWTTVNSYMKYRVVGGAATVVVKNYTGGETIGTLPYECRPDAEMEFAGVWGKSGTYGACRFTVEQAGTVRVFGLPSDAYLNSAFTYVIGNGYGDE